MEEPGGGQSAVNNWKREGEGSLPGSAPEVPRKCPGSAPGVPRKCSARSWSKVGLLLEILDLGGGLEILRNPGNPGYPLPHNTPGDPSFLGVGGFFPLGQGAGGGCRTFIFSLIYICFIFFFNVVRAGASATDGAGRGEAEARTITAPICWPMDGQAPSSRHPVVAQPSPVAHPPRAPRSPELYPNLHLSFR